MKKCGSPVSNSNRNDIQRTPERHQLSIRKITRTCWSIAVPERARVYRWPRRQCCWLRVTSETVRAGALSATCSSSCTASCSHSVLPCGCSPACDDTWYDSPCRITSPAALASRTPRTVRQPPTHTSSSAASLPAGTGAPVPEADLAMFSMFGRTGAPQKGGPHKRTGKLLLRNIQ